MYCLPEEGYFSIFFLSLFLLPSFSPPPISISHITYMHTPVQGFLTNCRQTPSTCLTLTSKQNICNFQALSGFTSCSRYYFCAEHPSPPHRNAHTYVKQLALQDAFSDSPTSYTTSQGWTSSL